MARWNAAEVVDRAARASNNRTRFPQGQLFSQRYQEDRTQVSAERKDKEKQRTGKKKIRSP